MQITPHFSWEEMTATSTGLENTPLGDVKDNLELCAEGMEKVRHHLGDLPISVNSGYRAPDVNEAVGGSKNSAHMLGFACDFTCAAFGSPLDICRHLAGVLAFDQLIEEGTWVHIAFGPGIRMEVLTKNPEGGYSQGLPS